MAPVLLTVYNRTAHLRQCIESLKRCPEAASTEIYIASDAAYRDEDVRAIQDTRAFIQGISGFKRVVPIFHEINCGLVKSYYHAVNLIFEKHDRYIFLEDDILVAPDFFAYMNQALEFYREDPSVFSVSAFSFSVFFNVSQDLQDKVYFTHRFYPWGYGQWKTKALKGSEYTTSDIDRSLKNPEFLKRLSGIGEDLLPAFLSLRAQGKMLVMDYLHTYHMVRNNLVAVAPYRTKSFNIGHDGSGSRTVKSKKFLEVDLSAKLAAAPYRLFPYTAKAVDETFNQAQFRNSYNRIKILLHRAGLLRWTMKAVNWYRGRG